MKKKTTTLMILILLTIFAYSTPMKVVGEVFSTTS